MLYMVLSGKPPFDGPNDDQILAAVKTGKCELEADLALCSEDARDLVGKLL